METQAQKGEHLAVLIIGRDDIEISEWVDILKKHGYGISYRRLESIDTFRSALQLQTWDMILSEYSLEYSNLDETRIRTWDALHLLQELKSEVPVIVIAESTRPNEVAQIMKAGAYDFLLKTNIHNLAVAVQRAREKALARRTQTATLPQLQENEGRFRKLADQAPVMLWIADTTGKCTFVNQRWNEFTGLPSPEGLGYQWIQVIHPDDVQRCLNIYRNAEQAREEFMLEYRMRHANGEYRWVLDTGAPQFDRNGHFTGFIGSSIDITDRTRRDEGLRLRDQLLDGVALATHELLTTASFSEGIQHVLKTLGEAADIERVYIFENQTDPTSETKTILARFAWMKNDHRTAPDISTLNQLSDSTLFPRWYDILASGRLINGRVLDFLPLEKSRDRKLRAILLVPIMIEKKFWGFLGFDDGNVDRVWLPGDESILAAMAGSIGAAIVRKRAEDALRQSEEHFRSLIENATDIITILDDHGILLYGSPAIQRTLGYDPDLMIGMNIYNLLHPNDIETINKNMEQIHQAPGVARSAEFRLKHIDGSWHHFEAIGKRLPDEQNKARYVINARDITKRKTTEEALHQSEERLRHSQKMEAVGRLAGGVAHDFNNLLTAILGYGELIINRLKPYDPIYREMEEICKAADRAHALTRQLLAFSRKQVLEPKSIKLNSVVVEMEKLLRRLIGEDVELATQLQPDLGMVKVDPGQMEQVIINLAVNARDAMPQGGKLIIRTAQQTLKEPYSQGHRTIKPGTYVTLAITDTGQGMDEYVKAHIFEPFFTTKEVGKGTGLGLSMVYGIIEQSGGHIMFDSESGCGTTWTIYIPRLPDGDAVDSKKPLRGMPRGTETILLVEDEAVVRDLARRILTDQGYILLTAINGPEAIELCSRQKNPLHLLLTDVVMPQMSGHALVQQLQAIYPNLKVLYMSGYAEETFHGIDPMSNENNFIQKPFTPTTLTQKIRDVLDRRN